MQVQPPRGTKDLLFTEQLTYRYIIEKARQNALLYGYCEITTPVFEYSHIFNRIGDSTDIIQKETYTFKDRSGSSLTLRPEGTAQICRALISNGLTQTLPCRFFNVGSMFRYERPQKGRYRQFTQASVELFGIDSYHGDIEVIQLAEHFLQSLNLRLKVELKINSLGDKESNDNYRLALINYLQKYKADLSNDSAIRLEKNPLRILDSKDIKDKKIIASAPLYKDYLNYDSKTFFDNIVKTLDLLNIKYQIDERLVRGLDYYCHTAFEYITDLSQSQNAVLAGGRYNKLVQQLGGPDVSGIGWAAGVDRLMLLLDKSFSCDIPIAILPITEQMIDVSWKIAEKLRQNNFKTEIIYKGNLAKKLHKADKNKSSIAVIIGVDDWNNNIVTIKNLHTSVSQKIAIDNLITMLQPSAGGPLWTGK